jgi:hypothetical protein
MLERSGSNPGSLGSGEMAVGRELSSVIKEMAEEMKHVGSS